MYRIEIDGLRALSVALIVLFHLQVPNFNGAFIGVDVFFVISGYLISHIILTGLKQGNFSFSGFYIRRINRIIPALLATVALGLSLAILVMTPEDLVYAAQQGLAAIFTVGNIFYWLQADYWDPNSLYKIFLHTWTLGVEEQFYLVYPFMLWAAYRWWGRHGVISLLWIMLVASTAASEYWLHTADPSASFYLTPLRFYEFALGGLGAILVQARSLPGPRLVAEAATLFGLALIAGSAFWLEEEDPFPGFNVLPATVGALLVLLGGSTFSARKLLSNRSMVWLGKASYSIYLVHWPLIVLYRYYSGAEFSALEVIGLAAVTLAVGTLMHLCVERPMRLASADTPRMVNPVVRRRIVGTGLSLILVSAAASVIILREGFPSRVDDSLRFLATRTVKDTREEKLAILEAQCPRGEEALCGQRKDSKTNIILLSDSRGPDLYIALRAAYPSANIQLSYKVGCPPVFDEMVATHPRYPGCVELNRQRLQAALDAPAGDIVFLGMNFHWLRAPAIVETVSKLVASGKRVYALGETQFIKDQNALGIVVKHGSTHGLQRELNKYLVEEPFGLDASWGPKIEAAGAILIDNRPFLTNDNGFRLFTENREDLIMYDRHHLTVAGAREYGRFLAKHYPID